MTVWTPQNPVDQAWVDKLAPPQPNTNPVIAVANSYIVVPQIPKASTTPEPYQVLDVSGNVSGGRWPYTFTIFSSTFPGGAIQMEPAGRLLYQFATKGFSIDNVYSAVIKVVDANLNVAFFTITTRDLGDGPLVLSGLTGGRIPDAHYGVPFAWQLIVQGGTAPWTFVFGGLNLPAFGFTFDATSGLLLGQLAVHSNADNIFLITGYNAGHDPNSDSPADATLGGSWKFSDP